MSYKTTDGLMRHLREKGILIKGGQEKRQLINTGYFHGYKGYRFFKDAQHPLPFKSYDEVYATIQYDSKLKSLFYEKMMYIETAVKNIALESILSKADSENLQKIYDRVICSYNNAPEGSTEEQRKKYQQNKLNLQNSVQDSLAKAYKAGNPQISHYYNNNLSYNGVPIWALLEIMTMGDFGYLLSCLTYDVRDDISKKLGLNVSSDTGRGLIYRYIYLLKDLRNAVAHNAVVFDTRFRKFDPTKPMKRCLEQELAVPYVNFKTIGDYVLLIAYYLRLLKVPKREIKSFAREFEKITEEYRNAVSEEVAAVVVRNDLFERMEHLKKII